MTVFGRQTSKVTRQIRTDRAVGDDDGALFDPITPKLRFADGIHIDD